MAIKMKATGNAKDVVPEGAYEGHLVKVEEAQNKDGGYLRWTFSISLHGEARNVAGVTGMTIEVGEKARFWVEALVGRPLKDGEEVDLEKLYGLGCRLELTVIEKDGRQFSRIGRVTRRGGLTLKAKCKHEPAAAPEADENPDEGVF